MEPGGARWSPVEPLVGALRWKPMMKTYGRSIRWRPKVQPAKVEPAKVEPAKVEPAKVEPAKVEPAKVKPAEVEPDKMENLRRMM